MKVGIEVGGPFYTQKKGKGERVSQKENKYYPLFARGDLFIY